MLHHPSSGSLQILSPPPPPQLVRALELAHIPFSVGHSIVATVTPHAEDVVVAIRELGLEWHVIFNKDAVMALPADVSKATGFLAALRAVDLVA